MKKYLVGFLVLGILIFSAPQAEAVTIDDLYKEVQGLKAEVSALKSKISGQVLGATTTVPFLYKGARGTDVAMIQSALKLESDGVFGSKTEAAVKAFQISSGLPVTGVVDSTTRSSIISKSLLTSVPACESKVDALPSVKFISPNGGEKYNAGESITIKWNTCNIPASTIAKINLLPITYQGNVIPVPTVNLFTANTGSATFVLPTTSNFPPLVYGNYYKFHIDFPSLALQGDDSDNYFSINNSPFFPGCISYAGFSSITGRPCNTSGSLDPECLAGGTYSSTTGMACNPLPSICPPSTPSSITVISPNGGEVYQSGQPVEVKWTSCNIPGNIAEINLIDINGWSGGTGVGLDKDLPNTGSHTVILPDATLFSSDNVSFGKYFTIEIIAATANNTLAKDSSDNLFTINQAEGTSCPKGYTGTYPDCVQASPTCADLGMTGIYPNCSNSCPDGWTGTYPDCVQASPTCADLGMTGIYPNCSNSCPDGWTGTYPDCVQASPTCADLGMTGIYPNCVAPSGDFPDGCSSNSNFSKTTGMACSDGPSLISYWWGKVNQHTDPVTQKWSTDPDGVSGANIDKLTYCKKWFPKTRGVTEFKNQTLVDWKEKGNVNNWTSTKMAYSCLQ